MKKDFSKPVFFPDATRAVVKTLDSADIESTKTQGVLVNTFHLWYGVGMATIKKFGGVKNFMGWRGPIISDSGGFQVMSLVKKGEMHGHISDQGVVFTPVGGKKHILTPEESIRFQMELGTDLIVVLDDFTDPKVGYDEAKESVDRTLAWAQRSKDEFERICKDKKIPKRNRPYIIGVVQGGEFKDLREGCIKGLAQIGFDGLGWGGWPFDDDGKLNFTSAEIIARKAPKGYLLYGLGIGKPEDIVKCVDMGYSIFDCVLPTRDARHGRLYLYNASDMASINIHKKNFYSYYVPDKKDNFGDRKPVSPACDCLLCTRYSRGYLAHLWKIKDVSAMRLATLHNLRFYSILMEKINTQKKDD